MERWKRAAEEMGDAMKSLGTRLSKDRYGHILTLEEMKSLKSGHATVSVDLMLVKLKQRSIETERTMEELDSEDEPLIKSITFRKSIASQMKVEKSTDIFT